jgi:hypothetical protein
MVSTAVAVVEISVSKSRATTCIVPHLHLGAGALKRGPLLFGEHPCDIGSGGVEMEPAES